MVDSASLALRVDVRPRLRGTTAKVGATAPPMLTLRLPRRPATHLRCVLPRSEPSQAEGEWVPASVQRRRRSVF